MMITLSTFFLLALALTLPPPDNSQVLPQVQHHRPSTPGHHRHPSPTPTPSPAVRVTIVNAMSVPSIALGTEGTNKPPAYPTFPQGEWTANEAVTNPEVHYAVRGTNGEILSTQTIRYHPVSSQYLLLTGDLSKNGPADRLPQVWQGDGVPENSRPNLQFHVIPYAMVCNDACHYRFINAMPGKTLIVRSIPKDNKPPQQLAYLAPGNSALLTRQPPSADYEIEIDGKVSKLSVSQEGAAGHCIIPFFLREGRPDYVRVFEEP
jgi:hypothetical protein